MRISANHVLLRQMRNGPERVRIFMGWNMILPSEAPNAPPSWRCETSKMHVKSRQVILGRSGNSDPPAKEGNRNLHTNPKHLKHVNRVSLLVSERESFIGDYLEPMPFKLPLVVRTYS